MKNKKKKAKRKLGNKYKCVSCERLYTLKYARQLTCLRDECRQKLYNKNVKLYKQTSKYKKWSKEYGKDWYYNKGGKAWLKKWRDKNRKILNERQRTKRYSRKINKRGARAEALKLGYRSMAEVRFAEDLIKRNISFGYEVDSFEWQPAPRKYSPDFLIFKKDKTFFFIEYKGRLTIDNRNLLKAMKKEYPYVDLRLVFQNSRKKLYKGSKTTYGQWADQYNFLWANNRIPKEWLDE